jgi:D-serine deaminase-like pyridoxal phosphate-dependent protein
MATPQPALVFPALADYRIADTSHVLTPALLVYPSIVRDNIAATIRVLGGDPNRWRPHVKTSKLGCVMRELTAQGVVNVKCATTLELITAAEAGATDLLVAYPMMGPNAQRVIALAAQWPDKRVSALIENKAQIAAWTNSNISLYVDVNGGMDRTGINQDRIAEIIQLAHAIEAAGLVFRGLHYYDGHMSKYADLATREVMAHQGYDQLMQLVAGLNSAGIIVEELVTSGTPAFPCAVSYALFKEAPFVHRVSPGTVVYGDCTTTGQLPESYGYRPAALVLATVVSHPAPQRITCDAGHKAVSADAGVPTCNVIGHHDYAPHKPSEEHLPIDLPDNAAVPALGEQLYLVPRHVCPTVNNFNHALLVVDGKVIGLENVTARGREIPIPIPN